MQLIEYMRNGFLSHEKLAQSLSESTRTVEKWARGERYPRPLAQKKIMEITNGLVTPNDFLQTYIERNDS
jgi:DNA-binding transcriptional regulator YiaG